MFHFPDAPASIMHRPGLTGWGLADLYFSTLKMDGWRCLIRRTAAGLEFLSKTGKPLPISPALVESVQSVLMPLPEDTLLDGEWQGRRPAFRTEALWAFDALRLPMEDGRVHDVRLLTATERFERLSALVPSLVVPHSLSDHGAFFDAHKHRPDAEGIVLKRKTSTYTGSPVTCTKNSGWIKVKWRAGESGESPI